MIAKRLLVLLFFCIGIACLCAQQPPATEVRAVWLTTNYGLDWPRDRSDVDVQKRELRSILDRLKYHHFNTIFFQVRTRGEVLYRSRVEPMASVVAKNKFFDPLAFAVEECHKRGLECHAWFVTYPLGDKRRVRRLGNQSVVKKRPDITKQFNGEWYLDPGNPQTDDYLLSMIREIVNGYDIDGIHFDYIRYPDRNARFPDYDTYRLHGRGKNKSQWRRENINRLVAKIYTSVKRQKPWVQVSSSPLGRYRTVNGKGNGWTALETVHQDAAAWLKSGKHDALYPMMYYKGQLFYPFLDDWIANANNRIVVPGLGTYQMIELGWSRGEITSQIDYTRRKKIAGQCYFRADNILSNTKGILFSLKSYYRYPAKLPAMTWLHATPPSTAYDLTAERFANGVFRLQWKNPDKHARVTYNVYRSETDTFSLDNPKLLLATGLRKPMFEYIPTENNKAYYYTVTVSDSYHNESDTCFAAFFFHSDIIK